MRRFTFLGVLLVLTLCQVALAEVPRTISYQGVLRSMSGSPIPNGNHILTLSLYTAATGGTAEWTETDTVYVSNCTFHTILGDGTALNLAFDEAYWLGVAVDGGAEQQPRTEFTASPYAFRAMDADHAAVADSVVGGGPGGDDDWVVVGDDMYSGVPGYVGVGTTTPTTTLHVIQSTGLTQALRVEGSVGGANPGLRLVEDGGEVAAITLRESHGNALQFHVGDAHEVMTLKPDGSVGIGTVSPTATLEVQAKEESGGGLRITDPLATGNSSPLFEVQVHEGLGGGVIVSDPNDQIAMLGDASGGSENGIMKLYQHGTEKIRLHADYLPSYIDAGDIAIGHTAPEEKLDVHGTVKMTSFKMATGAGDGKVLTSNASGIGTWVTPTTGGDITAVYADNGLTGGATQGDAHLSVDFAGGGSATTAARSDHDHDTRYVHLPYATSILTNGIALDIDVPFASDDPVIRGTKDGVDWWGIGVWGKGGYKGVVGEALGTGSQTYYGVYGDATAGIGGTAYGVYSTTSGGGARYAGFFDGVLYASSSQAGVATSRIDHPLDPANKYLQHSSVESPDMMNVYNGNVTLDGGGASWVDMPAWFETLNREFRYQLTCIGGFAPVYIAQKISGNRFQIAGGEAGMEVSWQVTGVRQDPVAEAHRVEVEMEKPVGEQGKYLHPELYGLPESLRIGRSDKEFSGE
ncbi:hypothetical protein ACFL6M_03900 [Candidatus Eisenbacteria bacterium]|uniref:Uncharacterized protein n=1 Tax=Eiseniibacteriota bacterium TaxID=2212470 RepID=A0ABV6YK57_UNCEI